jgi:serine/threonine protein kinase
MKDFAHPNVLMLSGVVVDNGSDLPLIVLPYMDNGDLKSFVANDPYVSVFCCLTLIAIYVFVLNVVCIVINFLALVYFKTCS